MSMASVPGRPRRSRNDAIGTVGGKSELRRNFNDFPRIIAAFPDACSDIVVETTEHLGMAAQAAAPVQGQARGRGWKPGDPQPGTLRRSKKTRFFRRRGTDLVLTGRVDFKPRQPTSRNKDHGFAMPVEVGSTRMKPGGGHYRVPSEEFMVPSIVRERPLFYARFRTLEARLT